MTQESNPPGKRPSDSQEIHDLVAGAEASHQQDAALLEKARRYEELLQAGAIDTSGASDQFAERIIDPAMAASMDVNREAVLRGGWVAQQIYKALSLSGDECREVLADMTKELRKRGGLFERYEPTSTASKIALPDEYVYVRAGAKIFDANEGNHGEFQYGAEMRTRLASTDPEQSLITDIPHPHRDPDAFYHIRGQNKAEQTAGEIHENPTGIAVIEDVYTYLPSHQRHRIASLARKETARIIQQDINPNRPEGAKITRFIANMFRVEGISFDGCEEVNRLKEQIANEVSILMHARSSEFDAYLAWTLEAKPIDVQFVPEGAPQDEVHTAKIWTGWETVVLESHSGSSDVEHPEDKRPGFHGAGSSSK